jgi:hypothetical protein
MAAKSVWVGLDVGADQMAVCCTDAAGKVLLESVVRTYIKGLDEKLLKAAEDHPICRSFLYISGVGPICALSF